MRVRALFFAAYREWAGHDSLEAELRPGATVADLVAEIRRAPGLDRLPAAPVVAVNEAYARLDQGLEEGDEVAFLPPVSGG
ncbi:MAG: MoaD/ThiS family protein [Gemmatimonadota bacterium]